MRGLDLFAGIGGASIAMQRNGIEVVAHAEIEPFPSLVLEHRFPGVPNLGDVSKITAEAVRALGRIDVVSFGSPCQDWSVAGKRLGLKGHRSSLFHEAIRIVRLCGPRFVVFENVPGLFSAAGGWDFAAVLDELEESGALDIAWRVLDAQWFGVPQRRRRIFLVADFAGECAGEILSLSEGVQRHPAPGREAGEEVARGSGYGFKVAGFCAGNSAEAGSIGYHEDVSPTLRGAPSGTNMTPSVVHEVAGTLGGGSGHRGWADDTDRMTFVPETVGPMCANGPTERKHGYGIGTQDYLSGYAIPVTHALTSEGHDASEDGTGTGTPLVPQPVPFDVNNIASEMNYSNPQPGDPVHPLRSSPNRAAIAGAGMAVRRLTPLECERLQGFPDNWTLIIDESDSLERIISSDSARYRALGNAWAVPVGEWVMQRLAEVSESSEVA